MSWASKLANSSAGKTPAAAAAPVPLASKFSKGQRVNVVVQRRAGQETYQGVVETASNTSLLLTSAAQMVDGVRSGQLHQQLTLSMDLVQSVQVVSNAAPAPAPADDLPVDQQIRSGRQEALPANRKLEKFFPASGGGAGAGGESVDLHAGLEQQSGGNKKFNQLQTLEKMTGRRSGFNMEDYSSKLDTSSDNYREKLALAEAMEAEINNSKPRNLRQALDRGMVARDIDDDQLFSAVQRGAGSQGGYVPPHRRDSPSAADKPPAAAADAKEDAALAKPEPAPAAKPTSEPAVGAAAKPAAEEVAQKPAGVAAEEKPKLKSKLRADAPAFVPSFLPPAAARPQPHQQQHPRNPPMAAAMVHVHPQGQPVQFYHHPQGMYAAAPHFPQMARPGLHMGQPVPSRFPMPPQVVHPYAPPPPQFPPGRHYHQ